MEEITKFEVELEGQVDYRTMVTALYEAVRLNGYEAKPGVNPRISSSYISAENVTRATIDFDWKPPAPANHSAT